MTAHPPKPGFRVDFRINQIQFLKPKQTIGESTDDDILKSPEGRETDRLFRWYENENQSQTYGEVDPE